MNAEQYRAVIGWFNARPAAKKALRLVSRSAVAHTPRCALGFHVCVDSRRLTW